MTPFYCGVVIGFCLALLGSIAGIFIESLESHSTASRYEPTILGAFIAPIAILGSIVMAFLEVNRTRGKR